MRALGVIALTVLAFGAFWPTTLSLMERWEDTVGRTYTHGYIVVALALWMIWRDRHRLAAVPAQPYLPAAGIAAVGAVCWLIVYRAGFEILHQAAFPVLLATAFLAAFGWRVLRVLAFPLAWLYLAIPVWDAVLPILNWISVFAVRFLLRVADVPAYFVNNTFEIPGGKFEIADGCSGVHFFVVALTVSLLYGEVNRDTPRTRVKLVVFALLLAMATNWLRIFIIVVAGYLSDMQHSLVTNEHYSFGWYMFAGMMVLYFFVVRRWPAPAREAKAAAVDDSHAIPQRGYALALLGLALAPLVVAVDANRAGAEPLARAMSAAGAPPEITAGDDGWRPQFPNADRELNGRYSAGATEVAVYVAGFDEQHQDKELGGSRTSVLGESLRRSRGALDAPAPWTELAATDNTGGRSLIWYAYRMDDRWYPGVFRMQIEYGLRSLAGAPAVAVVALRAQCGAGDCEAARESLKHIAENHYP